MEISNDRDSLDFSLLHSSEWSGMQQGIDGYPIKDFLGNYFIGAGKDPNFKATAIEFYGVRTQT